MAVAAIQGKGRGLVATAPAAVGDLLLVVQPLAYAAGQPGSEQLPDTAALDVQLAGSCSPVARAWLHALFRGPSAGTTPVLQHSAPAGTGPSPAELTALLHAPLGGTCSSAGGSGGVGTSFVSVPPASEQLPALGPDELANVVSFNAFGDRFDDAVAAEMARAAVGPPSSSGSRGCVDGGLAAAHAGGERLPDRGVPHVGLWPQFSLLNHSCLPNAIHYTIGRALVVRAAQPLQPGDEVTVSYLGTEDHQPADVRRQVLHARYGFTCACARCQLEDQLPSSLTSLLTTINDDVRQVLLPSFVAGVQSDDAGRLEQIGEQLVSLSMELCAHLDAFVASAPARNFQRYRTPSLRPGPRQWHAQGAVPDEQADMANALPHSGSEQGVEAVLCVEAAIYEFFQLMAMRDEAARVDHTASLQNCTRIVDAVSRGSELHTFLSARVLFRELRAAQHSAEGGLGVGGGGAPAANEAVARATADCQLAHVARYGRLPLPCLLQAFKASQRISEQFL